jgi:hypothetical protein
MLMGSQVLAGEVTPNLMVCFVHLGRLFYYYKVFFKSNQVAIFVKKKLIKKIIFA